MLYKPATVPRYNGGAISMRYSGAAVVASVEKKDSRKRPGRIRFYSRTQQTGYLPPMKMGIVVAVLVTIVPTTTPLVPRKMDKRRPRQSASQMKSAPIIWPIWKMEKMMPVEAAPFSDRP